ncbi:ABC transporter ATP-binding protein [Pseudoroseicyclus aestuarii]|uniref:ABC-2 type transport system ATP-binding protein n=1 Tax=Pseudoroseicyclus aestuarii TaxID=1795041 RepID=A0A318T0M5_9RHOB|nr:ABC transporter ATP-binding protein [Pseudoroseicyclus aestuarii]PYE83724.1 ABC-2 type transport system ATP-binding protein [Pseudoroseicyclus aestuarii]
MAPQTSPIVQVQGLTKTYSGGFTALDNLDFDAREGEILALLGPNGAGKTTLISTICGITRPTSGSVTVGGYDIRRDFRRARSMIGLVPQELVVEPFTKVKDTVAFSRGMFGKAPDPAHVEKVLKQLSLWDKRDNQVRELSGGMKRRVLIAKALAHEPRVLFLDEPTAGVDVELRKGMWDVVRELREQGVTVILTTHYIEEAEEMADRISVISAGRILLTEDKAALMRRMGHKELRIELSEPIAALPPALEGRGIELSEDGHSLIYSYDSSAERTGITRLLSALAEAGLVMSDLSTHQSSLEEIFVSLVHGPDDDNEREAAQ